MKLGWILKYLNKAESIVNNPFLYKMLFTHFVKYQAYAIERLPPSAVLVEGTNKCNAECITCSHKYMKRPQGVMDLELYKKIIDECSELKVHSVHPYGFGEPLLDPLLIERISYAKNKGIPYVPIFSNWSVLDKEKMINLINSGLDEVTVSYYGTDKKTFEEVRTNIKFDDVNSNIKEFLMIRNSMGRKKPFLNLFIVKHLKSEPVISKVYERWKGRVNEIFVWPASNWTGTTDAISINRPKIVFPCIAPWDTFTIQWDGNAVLCTQDYEGLCLLGNMKNLSIKGIRSERKIQAIRQKHLAGKQHEVDLCRNCHQITFSWPRWFMRALSRIVGGRFYFLKK